MLEKTKLINRINNSNGKALKLSWFVTVSFGPTNMRKKKKKKGDNINH